METALSFLKQLPETKDEINNFAVQVSKSVIDGTNNALEVYHQCKCVEETMKKILDNIKGVTIDEAEKWKGQKYKNSMISTKEAGVSYDYSVCDDSVWNTLNNSIEQLKAQIKEREKFLKSIQSDVFDDNGVKLNPPLKKSSGYSVVVTML